MPIDRAQALRTDCAEDGTAAQLKVSGIDAGSLYLLRQLLLVFFSLFFRGGRRCLVGLGLHVILHLLEGLAALAPAPAQRVDTEVHPDFGALLHVRAESRLLLC
jgi:hypothetical protein